MERRDYRRREPKKRKRDAKRVTGASILPPPATVEVIKKGREERGTTEE